MKKIVERRVELANLDYLTQKKPLWALLIFAAPIIIGNIVQQLYIIADSAIVGRFVSQQALAAVGACTSLTNVFICIAIGGGIGASVLVSHSFGAHEYGQMRTAALTSLISFLFASIALGAFGWLCSRQIMLLLNTPTDVIDMAVDYLKIYFLGLPFLFMYNVLAAMFNALGKSRIPLYFLVFSSVLNVILDAWFVIDLGWGIKGVAWATLIAQGLSAVASFLVFMVILGRLCRSSGVVFDAAAFRKMVRLALPSILQQSTVSIGMMLVQSVVNSFGSETLAGFSAVMRVEGLCVIPMSSISTAVSSYTAQNLGANKPERVPQGLRAANLMAVFFAVVVCIVMTGFGRPIAHLFLGDEGTPTAMKTALDYFRFSGWFFTFIGLKMAVDGVLRGSGDMLMFTVANLANLTVRVVLSVVLAPQFGVAWVWYAVPLGWLTNFIVSYAEYRTGKWRTKLSQPNT